jgi:2,4-dienoyl-CoA reductase-like NADH-dependent reductase (Old Yellow Enzyme family)
MSTLRSIERFLRRTGMAPTAFGRAAARDPRLVFDLRKGREPTERTVRRLEHFMNIYEGNATR